MQAVIKKKIVVRNKLGLHARPAALFVQIANKYDSTIIVEKGDQKVNGKSIMGILMLAVESGHEICLIVRGTDAENAVRELEELVSKEEEL